MWAHSEMFEAAGERVNTDMGVAIRKQKCYSYKTPGCSVSDSPCTSADLNVAYLLPLSLLSKNCCFGRPREG